MCSAAVLAVVGTVGTLKLGELDEADTRLYEKMTIPIGDMGQAAIAFHRTRVNFLEYLAETEAEQKAALRKSLGERRAEVADNLKQFETTILTDAGRFAFAELQKDVNRYFDLQDQGLKLDDEGKQVEAKALFGGEAAVVRKKVQEEVENLFAQKVKIAKETSAENARSSDAAQALMTSVMIAGVIAALVLGVVPVAGRGGDRAGGLARRDVVGDGAGRRHDPAERRQRRDRAQTRRPGR